MTRAAAPWARSRRDLVIAAVVVVTLSRLAEGEVVWLIGALVFAAVGLGTWQVLGDESAMGIPLESAINPAIAAGVSVWAIRLLPIGLELGPALLAMGILIDRCLRLEERIVVGSHALTASDRTALLVLAVVLGFIGFAGVGVLVPGGLADPGARGSTRLTDQGLLVLAIADGTIAMLLGYRLSVIRQANLRAAIWSAATYGGSIAIGAAALRAIGIHRLVGPAILTLVFFLWDAFHGASPARRRDPSWIWQTALLVVIGAAVVAWNLRIGASAP
jgi:hypothetical protein